MSLRNLGLMAVVAVVMLSQMACYNTYTISTSELAKLESRVERVEVVEVLADCPAGSTAYRTLATEGLLAQAADGDDETATDATGGGEASAAAHGGCTLVPVSTVNALTVLISDGSRQRVTPFNFVMDDIQLVSPEYNVLVPLSQVDGAEVREFSTWKTIATITGVSLVTVGTFVGISILAPDERGFDH
jgi:hypothetical protein